MQEHPPSRSADRGGRRGRIEKALLRRGLLPACSKQAGPLPQLARGRHGGVVDGRVAPRSGDVRPVPVQGHEGLEVADAPMVKFSQPPPCLPPVWIPLLVLNNTALPMIQEPLQVPPRGELWPFHDAHEPSKPCGPFGGNALQDTAESRCLQETEESLLKCFQHTDESRALTTPPRSRSEGRVKGGCATPQQQRATHGCEDWINRE